MTISANTVWEMRATATASNVNGGGFVTGASGVDYSQQDTAQYALTGVVTPGAGAVFNTALAAADMVGNICKVVSGTNFTVGWYQIISVVVGVSVTVDRACCTGIGALGVINIGGALSVIDNNTNAALAAGNTIWVKSGTYTAGGATAGIAGTAAAPIKIYGYLSTRGDSPSGSNRPVFVIGGSNTFVFGAFRRVFNIRFTCSGASSTNMVTTGTGSLFVGCSSIHSDVSVANKNAWSVSQGSVMQDCEGVSYRGIAFNMGTAPGSLFGCYAHNSNVGISSAIASFSITIQDCVISNCATTGISFTAALASHQIIINGCTIYGAENKLGTGISFVTGIAAPRIYNNIIYGCATGVSHADAANNGYDNYNNYYNNTADTSNWTKSSQDTALNPYFVNVHQLTGSTATTSGSVLTQSGANFSSVTDGVDYVYIKSGTGVTVASYAIVSHTATTLTLDRAPGTNATANKVWQITTGNNFAIQASLNGTPGVLGLSTGYNDMGALQKPGGGSYTFVG